MVAGKCWVSPEQRHVGMVFKTMRCFHLTVAENVASACELGKGQCNCQDAEQLIALAGLRGLENRYPHELSGGQQAASGSCPCFSQPKLILLDEPLSNLDMQVRLRLREEVREILKATGTSGFLSPTINKPGDR